MEDTDTPVADPEAEAVEETTDQVEAAPVETPAEPPAPVEPPPVTPPPTPPAPQDPPQSALERELADVEAKIQADDFDGYSKEGKALQLRHVRLVAKIEAAPAREVQQMHQEQQAARAYWQNWGKGSDVAQLQHKNVPAAKAKTLFEQAKAAVDANPRYAGRAEMDANTIVYDKWMDLLAAEAKKPTPAPARGATTSTRVTGSTPSGGTASGSAKTAKQKLEDGEYDDQLRNLVK